jgi:CheY-like chemotaxis protein
VSDEPWSGFNYYEGGLRSRVAINTDLPVSSTMIGHLVAHEAYPGHHTEHCRKEVGLVRQRRQLEESIFLVGTPQCLLAEGLADLAIEALLGPDHEPVLAELLQPLGIRYDTEVVAAVGAAAEALGSVRGNAALLVHDLGRPVEDAVAELERWGLQSHDRATKAMAFLTHPTWRAYIFCYVSGLPLCRRFVDGDPTRFDRLLTEQFVPADLVAA